MAPLVEQQLDKRVGLASRFTGFHFWKRRQPFCYDRRQANQGDLGLRRQNQSPSGDRSRRSRHRHRLQPEDQRIVSWEDGPPRHLPRKTRPELLASLPIHSATAASDPDAQAMKLLVQISEKGVPVANAWPDLPEVTESWEETRRLHRLAAEIHQHGVRADRANPAIFALLRSSRSQSAHRLLLRGRGATRLYIDEEKVLENHSSRHLGRAQQDLGPGRLPRPRT